MLEHGQIVEQGTHHTLLEKNGVYAHLYETQFKAADMGDYPSHEGQAS